MIIRKQISRISRSDTTRFPKKSYASFTHFSISTPAVSEGASSWKLIRKFLTRTFCASLSWCIMWLWRLLQAQGFEEGGALLLNGDQINYVRRASLGSPFAGRPC